MLALMRPGLQALPSFVRCPQLISFKHRWHHLSMDSIRDRKECKVRLIFVPCKFSVLFRSDCVSEDISDCSVNIKLPFAVKYSSFFSFECWDSSVRLVICHGLQQIYQIPRKKILFTTVAKATPSQGEKWRRLNQTIFQGQECVELDTHPLAHLHSVLFN